MLLITVFSTTLEYASASERDNNPDCSCSRIEIVALESLYTYMLLYISCSLIPNALEAVSRVGKALTQDVDVIPTYFILYPRSP